MFEDKQTQFFCQIVLIFVVCVSDGNGYRQFDFGVARSKVEIRSPSKSAAHLPSVIVGDDIHYKEFRCFGRGLNSDYFCYLSACMQDNSKTS